MKQLTEDQFYNLYTLQINHILAKRYAMEIESGTLLPENLTSFNGCLYETYGEELDYVISMIDSNRVVTIVEGDTDELDEEGDIVTALFYESGYHLVNRLGYLILEEPYTEEFTIQLD
jgi:hypothetical protein